MELLRKQSNISPDQEAPEICVRGKDLYQLADAANLLAKSEDNGSNYDFFTKHLDIEHPDINDFIVGIVGTFGIFVHLWHIKYF